MAQELGLATACPSNSLIKNGVHRHMPSNDQCVVAIISRGICWGAGGLVLIHEPQQWPAVPRPWPMGCAYKGVPNEN